MRFNQSLHPAVPPIVIVNSGGGEGAEARFRSSRSQGRMQQILHGSEKKLGKGKHRKRRNRRKGSTLRVSGKFPFSISIPTVNCNLEVPGLLGVLEGLIKLMEGLIA